MWFLVVTECGRAVGHRRRLVVVPSAFDSCSIVVECLPGAAGGMKGAVINLSASSAVSTEGTL